MHDGVVRAVLPWSIDGTCACHHNHVTCWWAGRSTLTGKHVEPVTVAHHLRPFEGEPLYDPLLRVLPAGINLLDGSCSPKSIGSDADAMSSAKEEIAFTILSYGVSRIDVALDTHIDWLAPGTAHVLRMDDIDLEG